MTVLLFTLGVLLFAIGVAVSIALHEVGHLLPGKLFGVKVTQYFIGFGPTVWSTRRGETEYGIKAVPFGGFVKLVGMLPPAKDGVPAANGKAKAKEGFFSQMVDDAREAEAELVEEGDEDRQFYKLPVWKKLVIMGSGVATNLVIAYVLFAAVFMGYGVPTATTTVESVSRCVIAVTEANRNQPTRRCTEDDPVAPALEAGIRPGDRFVSFNGRRIDDWDDMQSAIRQNRGGRAVIEVERDGETLTLRTNTRVTPRALEAGGDIEKVGFLGVGPTSQLVRQDAGYVATTMADATWQVVQGIATLPPKVYHVGLAALGLEERDPTGPMSVVGGGRVSGEIASDERAPLADRLVFIVTLIAGLNLFLGMLNLVPLLPLDGGQIAGALYEGLRRMVAKLRRRPDPGYVDVAKLLPIGYVMAGVILVASLVLIWGDIVAPIPTS